MSLTILRHEHERDSVLFTNPAVMAEMTQRELSEEAGRVSVRQLVEQEQAHGFTFGRMHQFYEMLRAPHRVNELLSMAALRPDLVCGQSDFVSPTGQAPNADEKAAINTTVTETNLWDPGGGRFLVPAETMRVGQSWQICFGGVMGTTATPTIQFTTRWGTNNSAPPTGTSLGAGPTVTLGTIAANQPWQGQGFWVCRDLGVAASTSTVTGSGVVWMPAATAATVTPHAVFGGTVVTNVDHKSNQGIGVSVTWGASSASNTITCRYAVPWTSG